VSHATQRDRLLALFEANFGKPVPLPEILALGIAQYNARIFELRREGFDVRSETVDVVGGQKHTVFVYHGRKAGPIHCEAAPSPSPQPRDSGSGDWYERQFGARPKESSAADLPLFSEAQR
jgi:hypothetical protein